MAEARNPFGTVLPFPRKGQPLGEGGGGFSPSRVTSPTEFQVKRQMKDVGKEMEGIKAAKEELHNIRLGLEYSPKTPINKEKIKELNNQLGAKGRLDKQVQDDLFEIQERLGMAQRRRALDPSEGKIDTSFQTRRGVQRAKEAEGAIDTTKMAGEHNKKVERLKAGREWLANAQKPKAVTPEVELEKRIGFVGNGITGEGHIMQATKGGHMLYTNPISGKSVVSLKDGTEYQFKTRLEALRFMAGE